MEDKTQNTIPMSQNINEYKLKWEEKWKSEQLELKKKLITQDNLDWNGDDELKRIGGVDISFVKENEEDACASLVVLSYPDFKVIYQRFEMVKLDLPYISGFLAFREVPFLVKLIEELRTNNPNLLPQIIFVDGNGFLHPRGFGLACHLGVLTSIPTVGIGKSYFQVDGITLARVKELEKTLKKGGDFVELVGNSGTIWGALFRSTDSSGKAIFISLGHRISLSTCLELVKKTCKYRIPEPVRQADLLSREFIRRNVS